MKNTGYILIGRILLSNNNEELLIHAMTWMDPKKVVLSERSQIKKIYIHYVSIYIKSENRLKESMMTESESRAWG